MKIKFTKFERVAGIFVGLAILGTILVTLGAAAKKGWFAKKIHYETTLENAEGIHDGTVVQIAGLRAGSVEDVDLISANEVRVKFEVLEKFQKRVREDSVIQVVRPFIIGEKVFDVSVGSEEKQILASGSKINSIPSSDIMDVVNGRKMGPFLAQFEKLMDNLKLLADAFGDRKRTDALIRVFDRIDPLVKNMILMSQSVTRTTDSLNEDRRLEMLVTNLVPLTEQLQVLGPALKKVGPQLPQASMRALEALDEAVVLLKAMQKSFLLSGKVEDVRAEEAKRAEEQKVRTPTSEDK